MVYRFVEHTADVALELSAPRIEDLFADAVVGLAAVITDPAALRPQIGRTIRAEARSLDLLLVEWLSETLYLFETRDELYCEAEVVIDGSRGARVATGRVRGERFDPSRHPLRAPVKGVTYHSLAVERRAGG